MMDEVVPQDAVATGSRSHGGTCEALQSDSRYRFTAMLTIDQVLGSHHGAQDMSLR
jgi:hypothetical protein